MYVSKLTHQDYSGIGMLCILRYSDTKHLKISDKRWRPELKAEAYLFGPNWPCISIFQICRICIILYTDIMIETKPIQ
jgi:hypothetical protein